jgi:hypothetical protein
MKRSGSLVLSLAATLGAAAVALPAYVAGPTASNGNTFARTVKPHLTTLP